MLKIISILEIAASIYILLVARNMIALSGRQKGQILSAIPDPAKAAEYGKKAGVMLLITGIGVIAFACYDLAAQNEGLYQAEDIFILLCALAILRLNKKYSGKYSITIY